jgi:hypothetical protein
MLKSVRVLLLLVGLLSIAGAVRAEPIVWTGATTTFTKVAYADWTLPANQDRITPDVWLTRKTTGSLFNIFSESAAGTNSPAGTEWAFGSAANWASLSFQPFITWNGNNPTTLVGKPAVLHLIPDNIYLDIMFTYWPDGKIVPGAPVTYERSTPSVPEPSSLAMLGILGIAAAGFWWRKR